MDIEIKELELENLIGVLEDDNKNMIEAIDSIYDAMIKIEKNDWSSPEKTRLDEGFIPYLKRQSDVLNEELTSRTEILKEALQIYRSRNATLEKQAKDLEVL